MMKLLVFKERMKQIYSKYSMYILPAMKFILTLVAMLVINGNVGYMRLLKSPAAAVLIAAVCSFIPAGIIVIVLTLVILAHLYSLAMELALASLIIILIMFIFYYRFTARDSYVLILMPVLFFLKMPYIMPLMIGLVFTPVSIVSMTFGVILYYIMSYAKVNAASIANSAAGLDKIVTMLKELIANKEMILMIVVFAIITILVYTIRRLSVDHSHTIAIVAGGILQLFVTIISTFILNLDGMDSILVISLFSIISIGIVYLLNFFILSVDYTRTEFAQFEDDEYYYYVKAVPKVSVTVPEVKVKHINVQKVNNKR